ncbi:SgcJ/EcaC family oxidoreductase [Streptomyces sp. NPDC057638]|uniref:SgcJ/EcaC family oxidoreductase n=1 Tax=Streptomyces sp. NPDC057638 TaxID=3346190 RepID=UPI00369778F4
MTTQTITAAARDAAPAAAITDEDRAAIAALPQRVVAAWAAQDADAFAEVFTPDGTMIIPGVFQQGREAIRSFLAQAFQGPFKGTRVTGTPVDLRFAGAESGILITRGGILAPGESEPSAERAVNASWVVIKRDGRWLLAAYQNSPRNAA